MFSLLDLQVLLTLSYSAQFEFPLAATEIKQRLVGDDLVKKIIKQLKLELKVKNLQTSRSNLNTVTNQQKISHSLNNLINQDLIVEFQNHYLINSDENSQIIIKKFLKQRRERAKVAREHDGSLRLITNIFKKIPWILATGITGSLAVKNATRQDDIDFLVVVQKNRLWLTRVAVLIIALILGKKDFLFFKHQSNWCFNIWLEQDLLSLPLAQRNLYSAYETIQVAWFYDTNNIQQQFLLKNDWVLRFLAVKFSYQAKSKGAQVKARQDNACCASDFSLMLTKLNRLIFKVEKKHLHKKNNIPNNRLSLTQAFLHDGVSHQQYLISFLAIFKKTVNKVLPNNNK